MLENGDDNVKRKAKMSYAFLALFVVFVGIGYAVLQANLQINGVAKISENRWDIHFENVVVNPDSVSIGTGDSAAVVNPNDNKEVTYVVTLNQPGDFYEFTVDVKNDGTIDGMIEEITSTLRINNGSAFAIADDKSNLPVYLDYSITYSDDVEIEANHELKSGAKETYKVRVEFKKDIDISDLPGSSETLSFSMTPIMVQSNSNAIPSHGPSNTYYVVSNINMSIGHTVPEQVRLRATPEEAMADWQDILLEEEGTYRPCCLKLVLDEDQKISEAYVVFVINDDLKEQWIEDNCSDDVTCAEPYENELINGIYSIKGGDNGDSYEANYNVLREAFPINGDSSYFCYGDDVSYYTCSVVSSPFGLDVSISNNGFVRSQDDGDGGRRCFINDADTFYCA